MNDDTRDGNARCKTCGQFYGDLGLCVTPGCAGDSDDEDMCAYCGTIFEPEDLFFIEPRGEAKAMLAVLRVARCHACHAVHSQGTCGTCNTEAYHPTIDNTPWGEQGCRRCTTPDPFTNLLGFVSTVVVNAVRDRDTTTRMQEANTDYANVNRDLRAAIALLERERGEAVGAYALATRLHMARIADLETQLAKTEHDHQRLHQRNEEVYRINEAVHDQMAHVLRHIHERVLTLEPMTPDEACGLLQRLPKLAQYPAEMGEEYATQVATTSRFHGDVHIGPMVFNTITDAVRASFLDGMAAGIRWEGERRASMETTIRLGAAAATSHMPPSFQALQAERQRQIAQGYTPEHDDQHTLSELNEFIEDRTKRLQMAQSHVEAQHELIAMAALAIAGWEKCEREDSRG